MLFLKGNYGLHKYQLVIIAYTGSILHWIEAGKMTH